MKRIYASQVGLIARRLLGQVQDATVMGVTSRGVFLYLASEWVIFLSLETYHGPLTINLGSEAASLNRLVNGQAARVTPEAIRFREAGLVISMSQARIWQAPALPLNLLPPDRRNERLVESVIASSLNSEYVVRPSASQSLVQFLGVGPGLTPAGDDQVAGYLLALSRWGHILAPEIDLRSLAAEILPLAYARTTTLSANLIECAAQGQADERLFSALDGILSGEPDAAASIAALLQWGSSSGYAALAGMLLAILGRDDLERLAASGSDQSQGDQA